MTKCVYCNRAAVEEVTEAYVVQGVQREHHFSHCSCCGEDFVTSEQNKLNEANRSKP